MAARSADASAAGSFAATAAEIAASEGEGLATAAGGDVPDAATPVVDVADIEAILRAAPGLVVIDEIQRAKPASAKGRYLRKITVSSTMGPGVQLDIV